MRKSALNITKLILFIILINFSIISKSYALTVNFSIETFVMNHLRDSEMLNTVGVLDGYSQIYKPADELQVIDQENIGVI